MAGYVVLVGLALIPIVWHNRHAIQVAGPEVDSGKPQMGLWSQPYVPLAVAVVAIGLGYLYTPENLELKSWLALVLLLGLGALGIINAYPNPRLRNLLPFAQPHHWGTGALFFFGAAFFRLLFPGPAEPDWIQVSGLPSLTGTLYRVLGEDRAVLIPITLSCLLPVTVWWVSRNLVGPRIALATGLLTVLHPYAIWSAEFGTSLGLSPLLMILLFVATRQVWRTQQSGAWLWMGLLWGMLWVESRLSHFLLLVWLAGLGLVLLRIHRPSQNLQLHLRQGLWCAAGLIVGLFLWGAPWSHLAALDAGGGVWQWSPHLPQLMSAWFQPHFLDLPFAVTLFLPLDGVLSLLGFGLCVVLWRRNPILAIAALGWLASLLWPTPNLAQMLEIAHLTMGLAMLLIAVGIGLLVRLMQELVLEPMASVQEVLPWTAALVLAIQFPGAVLGENLAMNLVQGLRGSEGITIEQPEQTQPLTRVPVKGEPAQWPAELVWRSEAICEAGVTQPRGIAIDPDSGQVWVSGGPPGYLMSLDLSDGRQGEMHVVTGLQEPADIIVRGPDELNLIDAAQNQVLRFQPSEVTLTVLNESNLLSWPRGFGVSPIGGFLVADTAHSRIAHLNADGEFLNELQYTPGHRHVVQPTDVVAVGDRIWIVDPEVPVLMEMTEGLSVDVVQKGWTFNGPHFASLPDDTFLLSDPAAGSILNLASSGHLLSRVTLPKGMLRPVALDAMASGDDLLLAVTEDAQCQVWLLRLPVEQ